MNHLDRYLATAACTFTRVATRVIPNRHMFVTSASLALAIRLKCFKSFRSISKTTHSCAIRAYYYYYYYCYYYYYYYYYYSVSYTHLTLPTMVQV